MGAEQLGIFSQNKSHSHPRAKLLHMTAHANQSLLHPINTLFFFFLFFFEKNRQILMSSVDLEDGLDATRRCSPRWWSKPFQIQRSHHKSPTKKDENKKSTTRLKAARKNRHQTVIDFSMYKLEIPSSEPYQGLWISVYKSLPVYKSSFGTF